MDWILWWLLHQAKVCVNRCHLVLDPVAKEERPSNHRVTQLEVCEEGKEVVVIPFQDLFSTFEVLV